MELFQFYKNKDFSILRSDYILKKIQVLDIKKLNYNVK